MRSPSRLARWAAFACGAALLSACSSFQGHTVANVKPFAENTLAMVSQLRLTVQEPVYTRAFMAGNADVAAARQYGSQLRQLLRGMIFYSLQMSAIADAHLTEQEKVQELARYLNDNLRPAIMSQKVPTTLTVAQLDSVLTQVRAQTTYLAALGEATPFVEEVVETSDRVVTEFENHVSAAEGTIAAQIDSAYAPYRANDQRLQALEVVTMRRYALLDAALLGDSAVMPELRALYPFNGRLEPKELDRLEKEAFGQLASLRQLREQMRGESELYANRMKELDELAGDANLTGRVVRTSIILWARAYRNMAAGLALPPAIDLTAIISGLSRSVPKM